MSVAHEEVTTKRTWRPPRSDAPFFWCLGILAAFYLLLIAALLLADVYYAGREWNKVWPRLLTPEIRYSTWLSLVSCSITTVLCLWVAVPIGYLMSRFDFPGKSLVDALLDVPIFLPPLVVGLSLLILFRQTPLIAVDEAIGIALHVPAVILAQFTVACAFAVRTLRATFDEISPRLEQVALTLGCSRAQAFFGVVLPEARRGLLTAGTLAWARSLGEFGPILIFAGTVAMKTEVLPVSVHMEFQAGHVQGAVGVSLLMVAVALTVLVVFRLFTGVEHSKFSPRA